MGPVLSCSTACDLLKTTNRWRFPQNVQPKNLWFGVCMYGSNGSIILIERPLMNVLVCSCLMRGAYKCPVQVTFELSS